MERGLKVRGMVQVFEKGLDLGDNYGWVVTVLDTGCAVVNYILVSLTLIRGGIHPSEMCQFFAGVAVTTLVDTRPGGKTFGG